MGVKEELKSVLENHIGEAVSSHFLEKSLEIINESADNKESFIAVADRICKRIALFIDKNLAQTAFERLMVEIEKKPLSQGTKRRYKRVTFCKKVLVRYDGGDYELDSENLSEGGMFIRMIEPFPAGSKLAITFSLGVANQINVMGKVVYETKNLSDSKLPPGMAIEFKEVGVRDIRMLRDYIQEALKE